MGADRLLFESVGCGQPASEEVEIARAAFGGGDTVGSSGEPFFRDVLDGGFKNRRCEELVGACCGGGNLCRPR